jgi:hypothetical protein
VIEMVVLGSIRLVCPHCRRVQFQPIARHHRCRVCGKTFAQADARPRPPSDPKRQRGARS